MSAGAFPLVTTSHLARLVINRLHHAFRKSRAIVAAPTFGFFVVIEDVVHTERPSGVDVKQAGVGTVTRRMPIRSASLIGCNKSSVELWFLCRIRNRLTFRVRAQR